MGHFVEIALNTWGFSPFARLFSPQTLVYGLNRRATFFVNFQDAYNKDYTNRLLYSKLFWLILSPAHFGSQTTNSLVMFFTILFLGLLTTLLAELLCCFVLHSVIIPSAYYLRKAYLPLNFRYLCSACFPYIIVYTIELSMHEWPRIFVTSEFDPPFSMILLPM